MLACSEHRRPAVRRRGRHLSQHPGWRIPDADLLRPRDGSVRDHLVRRPVDGLPLRVREPADAYVERTVKKTCGVAAIVVSSACGRELPPRAQLVVYIDTD